MNITPKHLRDAGFIVPDHLPPITAIHTDSRKVTKGSLFIALPGAKEDGRKYVAAAIAAGAAAVAVPSVPVPVLCSQNIRKSTAHLAASVYPNMPETMVAVTGTNGKTSTAHIAMQLWNLMGVQGAAVGTLGVLSKVFQVAGSLTTPDPLTLHEQLSSLAEHGVTHTAMEASSHGLDQYRLDGVRLKAAAFTNLSRDHLDYHADMEAYFAAKARLFTELLPPEGTAVINVDDPWGQKLAGMCGHNVCGFGKDAAATLRLLASVPKGDGQDVTFVWQSSEHSVFLPLAGNVQAENLLAAMGLLLHTGSSIEALVAAIPHLQPVTGRLERASPNGHPFPVYIDYAHTPDALERALFTLRQHTTGKLWVVFGCGGNRDSGKRPLMGEIAARCADSVIITDDNPRFEDASLIRAAILTACPHAREIGDRRAGIEAALSEAVAGDTVLIAGKGHENGQIVGDEVLNFSDFAVVREILGS